MEITEYWPGVRVGVGVGALTGPRIVPKDKLGLAQHADL